MYKLETINKFYALLKEANDQGCTSFCNFLKERGEVPSTFYSKIARMKKELAEGINPNTQALADVIKLYEQLKNNKNFTLEDCKLDSDIKVETSVDRNTDGNIYKYNFTVYRKDNTPVTGSLTRDEMNSIYRLYSYYGAGITQRQISRLFPDYSLMDFKRILKAFNITKASGPFAPHMYEEKSEEELKEIHLREKEYDFLKKIEKDELTDLKATAIKLAKQNKSLEDQLNAITNIDVNNLNITPIEFKPVPESGKSIILHLSDLHIGATCESNTLYPNEWNKNELVRRLNEVLIQVSNFGHFDNIIITLLGDLLDGMDNQTARRDHIMPQNMDNMQQISTMLEVLPNFIVNCRNLANKVSVYSVKCGNHDGFFGYAATLALQNVIKNVAPDIEFTVFKDFFGKFEFKGHIYILAHGKDEKFMKRPLPLNLDEHSKVMIYEWLEANNISGNNIHVVKGDLHSNALNSCMKFDYRNVLSLFGASDYSNFNFSRNSYGVSYELFIGNFRNIGTFENF